MVLFTLLCCLALSPARVLAANPLSLKSNVALVVDQDTGESLVSKNADVTVPIASLAKLMTALVVVEGRQPMDEILEITKADLDRDKHTHSRLKVGTKLSRSKMLLLALMASENRASMALSRNYPGGREAFIDRMNARAKELGMKSSHFADPAGLSDNTVSTARDLLRLINAANSESMIRRYSTQKDTTVKVGKQQLKFVNTNRMVRSARDWEIGLQKTGFTNEAGRCLVMRATTLNRRLSMVFLNSVGTLTRFADAARVRQHLQKQAKKQQNRQPRAAISGGDEATS